MVGITKQTNKKIKPEKDFPYVNRKGKLLKPQAWLNLPNRSERRKKVTEPNMEPWGYSPLESVAWALRRGPEGEMRGSPTGGA